MLSFTRDQRQIEMLKQTGINVAKIAGLYLASQTLSTKLRETTKNTADLAAQQIRYIRNRYSK